MGLTSGGERSSHAVLHGQRGRHLSRYLTLRRHSMTGGTASVGLKLFYFSCPTAPASEMQGGQALRLAAVGNTKCMPQCLQQQHLLLQGLTWCCYKGLSWCRSGDGWCIPLQHPNCFKELPADAVQLVLQLSQQLSHGDRADTVLTPKPRYKRMPC